MGMREKGFGVHILRENNKLKEVPLEKGHGVLCKCHLFVAIRMNLRSKIQT